MTADELLAFLAAHQPMPSDADITEEEADAFVAALTEFEARPDDRCIPLFINTVSLHTGLGMYEHIKFVLMAHPREAVIPHLARGLASGVPGVQYRCCWWAGDLDALELLPLVEPLVHHEHEDIRIAAGAFLGHEPA